MKFKTLQKKWLVPFFLLVLVPYLSAQDITLTAQAPQKVYERDYIIVKYSINTEIKDYSPELTFPPELKLQFGPHVFRSKTMVSGVISHTTAYSYNLEASQPGTYTLPPLTIDVDGQSYTSEALTVEVMKSDPTSSRDLFLEARLGRPSVSVNQMVRYTVKLYTTGSVTGMTGGEMIPPAFDGFSVKQVKLPDPQFERVTYNGRTAYSCKLAEYWLFPEHPDTLTIEPSSVELCVAKDTIEKIVTVESPALRLVVEPLPDDDVPPLFTGIVGSYNTTVSIDTTTVKVGEPVRITLRIAGTGNMDIPLPELTASQEVDITTEETENDMEVTFERVSGTRTFVYTVIPKQKGKLELHLPGLVSFIPLLKKYTQEEDSHFTVTVNKRK